MPLAVTALARSHVGLVRSGNEDSGFAGRTLFVIADGMGGHAAGEVASRTVVAALLGLDGAALGPDPQATLRSAVLEANDRLRVAVAARPDLDGMGTTLTALVWDQGRIGLVHVGDSRAYLFRDGRLRPLTHDQSLVQSLVDEGRLTEAEARTHPQRSVILQALDGRPDIEPQVALLEPFAGDRYLICSDGLTDFVEDESIAAALAKPEAAAAVDTLITLSLKAGAPDNVTVVVLDVADVPDTDAATGDTAAAGGGVLVGAVSETAASQDPAPALTEGDAPDADSADTDDALTDGDVEDEDSAEPERRRRRRRWPWLALALVVVIVAGLAAARAWAMDQWYVGVDNGMVAVYSGLDVSLGPVSLSQLQERTSLETATLPEFARAEVENGIKADSRAGAEAVVARLQSAADSCLANPTEGCP